MSVDDRVACAEREIVALQEDLKESQQNEEHFRKLSVFYKEESARSEENKTLVFNAFMTLQPEHQDLNQKMEKMHQKHQEMMKRRASENMRK